MDKKIDRSFSSISQFQDQQKRDMRYISHPLQSKYFHMYRSFFKQLDNFRVYDLIASSLEELNQNKIYFSKQKFSHQIGIIVLSHSINWKIVNILTTFSFFSFQLLILNRSQNSVFTKCENIQNGGTGSIYILEDELSMSKYIVKSIRQRKQQDSLNIQMSNVKKSAIKQYCLNKLCSVLQIGPKTSNLFGFDLIVTDSSVDFALEQCKPLKRITKLDFQLHLKILHELRIVHGDIKCGNLMWSPSFRKPVLIDFGLSKVLKQIPGQLTYTHFFGTILYCSPQMKQLLNQSGSNSIKYIDLYYNDIFCLEQSISISDNIIKISLPRTYQKLQPDFETKIVHTLLYNFRIMRHIYNRDITGIIHMKNTQRKYQIFQQTIQIFNELASHQILYRIICILETMSTISSQQIEKIKLYHRGKGKNLSKIKNNASDEMFKTRIQQILKVQIPINGLMTFLLVFCHEDITPRSKNRRNKLRELLLSCQKVNHNFAIMLVQYVSNIFTSEQNIKEIFKKAFSLLQVQNKQELNLHTDAYSLALLFYEKFSVSLIQIESEIRKKKVANIKQECNRFSDQQIIQLLNWMYLIRPIMFSIEYSKDFLNKVSLFNLGQKKNIINLIFKCDDSFIIRQEQNKLLFQCYKIEAASKSLPCRLNLQNKYDVMKDSWVKHQIYIMQKQKHSFNFCFNPQTMVFFNFYNFIESKFIQGSASIDQILQGIRKMNQFFDIFFSSSAFSTLSLALTSKIKRFKHYKNYESVSEGIKIVKVLYVFHQQIFFKNLQTIKYDLNSLLNAYECFYAFTFFLDNHQFSELGEYLKKINIGQLYELDKQKPNTLFRILRVTIELKFRLNLIKMVDILQILDQGCRWFENTKALSSLNYYHYALRYPVYANQLKRSDFYGQKIQNLLSHINILEESRFIQFLQFSFLSPYMQMYYAMKKIDYFNRAFQYLTMNMQIYNKCSKLGYQMEFMYFLYMRSSVWPYLNKDQVIFFSKKYIQNSKQIRKTSQTKFLTQYANLSVIYDMLLTSIYIYKLSENNQEVISQLLLLMQMLLKNTSTIASINIQNRYYIILNGFISENVVLAPKKRKKEYYLLKEYRNSQYPIKNEKHPPKDKQKWSLTKSKIMQKVEMRKLIWNENKKMKIKNLQSNLDSLPLSYYQFMINQSRAEESVLYKEIDKGFPKLYKSSEDYWGQVPLQIQEQIY